MIIFKIFLYNLLSSLQFTSISINVFMQYVPSWTSYFVHISVNIPIETMLILEVFWIHGDTINRKSLYETSTTSWDFSNFMRLQQLYETSTTLWDFNHIDNIDKRTTRQSLHIDNCFYCRRHTAFPLCVYQYSHLEIQSILFK